MISYDLIRISYPIFLIMMLLEAMLIQRRYRENFSWKESLASFGIAAGHRITDTIFGIIPLSLYSFVWQHRLFTIDLTDRASILLLFFGLEFLYYWYHRFSHEIPWLWATHAVHHSVNHFNLTASFRLGWTGILSGHFLFFIPLCWLGFQPKAIAITLGLNLLYQFWIHTELIPKLGWLEWILNTPSHHRVHHASNPEYLDKNYGGVLIIFDRLLGTYAEERGDRSITYGLTHPLKSYNPVTIAFREWVRLFQHFQAAKTWGDRCQVILGRPT
ncbi:MAG: sterol desaturase family protein [Leptolyngbyaceae bacterium]|nr:sterol desaturase family protein [Leptolyngbyaceae bacterium]